MAEMTAALAEKLLREYAVDATEDTAQELVWIADFVRSTEERRKFDTDAYRVNMNVVRESSKWLKMLIEQQAQEIAKKDKMIDRLKHCRNCLYEFQYLQDDLGNCKDCDESLSKWLEKEAEESK